MRPRSLSALSLAGAILAIPVIGWIDYLTGTELRIYPLYFFPISWIAWRHGVRIAEVAGVGAAAVWLGANQLAGLHFSSAAVWAFNAAMHAASFILVAVLLSRLRSALQRERALARRDPLTGLLNSRAFAEQAGKILATCHRYRHAITLAYLDLDDFKGVNDRGGHAAGDQMLQEVGAALRTLVRSSDLAARLGGDEFVVLLPETATSGAQTMLARLHASLTERLRELAPGVGVSIGAIATDVAPSDLDVLVGQADIAMYEGKAAGKNRVTLRGGGSNCGD